MISTSTNLTTEQQQELDALYDAVESLTEYDRPNNIHEYLTIIDKLLLANKTTLNANTYNLLRFPVTEPVFEINPDTRDIIVPKAFKENGLTIQGDKLAEIVWFKMPRFFDLTDFYNFNNNGTKKNNNFEGYHTYIEWYNPAAAPGDNQKGVDLAYAMTCNEDSIYFGWPLGDKISGVAGTIQFTVRFLGVEEGQILYNFSTKIQSCLIKSTLNFDLLKDGYTADSWEELIYSRPVYSGIINSIESYSPIILQGLSDDLVDLEYHEATTVDGVEQPAYYSLPLTVKAAVKDLPNREQELVFLWKQLIDGATALSAVTPDSPDAERITNRQLTGEEAQNYNIAEASTFTVSKVGEYTVLIGNKLEGSNKIRYVYTGIVKVPGPTEPQITCVTEPDATLTKGYINTVTKNLFTLEKDINEFKVTVTVNDPTPGDTISYQWYRIVPVYNEETDTIEYVEEMVPQSEHGNEAVLNPEKEGKYYVVVTASRNGESVTVNTKSNQYDLRDIPQFFGGLNKVGEFIDLEYDPTTATFTAKMKQNKRTNVAHKIAYTWVFSPTAGRADMDNIPDDGKVEIGGVNGVPYNNNTFHAYPIAGTYSVRAQEIVFDTEEAPENRPLTLKTPENFSAYSNSITLTDNYEVYEDEATPSTSPDNEPVTP